MADIHDIPTQENPQYPKWFSRPFDSQQDAEQSLSTSFFSFDSVFRAPTGEYHTCRLQPHDGWDESLQATFDEIKALTGFTLVSYTLPILMNWVDYGTHSKAAAQRRDGEVANE